jgi:Mn2+/Fe2+ NRAMP family transporter
VKEETLLPVSVEVAESKAPPSLSFLKLAGPGLIVAASGIGSGDVVSATVGGANYGVVLLWGVAVGAFFKFVLNEGIARFQLATGMTALEGWAQYLPRWVKAYFGVYLIFWTVAVSAALTNATGLGIANLTGGAISQPWGAVLHSLLGFVFVLLGGATLRGLLVPTIPAGSGTYVLSIIGGIGGSITMLSYNYWMREEKISDARYLGYVRGDIAIAYLFTALFGISIMLIANQAFFVPNVRISDAQAVPKMAEMLGNILGPFGAYAYSVGFWAAVFASLLGVWQSVPYIYADFYSILKKDPEHVRKEAIKVTSIRYRLALLFITLAPMPFAFIRRPLFIIVTYTIVGSLFIPFLAATLLHLNNRVNWTAAVPHNRWTTNALLFLILALFAGVGVQEIINAL